MGESNAGSWGGTSEEILRKQFPMHRACRDGDVQTLSSLLGDSDEFGPANGLFVEDTFYGWTPAHWAAYFGKLPCLVRLIEHGDVSCNVTTFRFHQTPVHIAAFGSHGHCLQWLLQRGALINQQDYLGETCLHKAARTGSMECISLLVSQGAKLSTTNYNKQTATDLSLACGFPECRAYLERCLQLQQPSRGIFQELLSPVSHPPAPIYFPSCPELSRRGTEQHNVIVQGLNGGCVPNTDQNDLSNGQNLMSNGHNPMSNGQNLMSNGQNCMSNGQNVMSNGQNCMSNGQNGTFNGHCEHGNVEDSMDTSETATEVLKAEVNGTLPHSNGMSNGDVMLSNGISRNYVPVAGRKRSREDVDEECLKRIRTGEYTLCADKACANAILSSYAAVLAMSTEPLVLRTTIQPQLPRGTHYSHWVFM